MRKRECSGGGGGKRGGDSGRRGETGRKDLESAREGGCVFVCVEGGGGGGKFDSWAKLNQVALAIPVKKGGMLCFHNVHIGTLAGRNLLVCASLAGSSFFSSVLLCQCNWTESLPHVLGADVVPEGLSGSYRFANGYFFSLSLFSSSLCLSFPFFHLCSSLPGGLS
ncbi:hypothetical protein LZ30DRAFT_472605 [Colletotrichum cereale]|nr:hypothetical protein LZ30DRAFT_472605 [Colletotrichum cereale]